MSHFNQSSKLTANSSWKCGMSNLTTWAKTAVHYAGCVEELENPSWLHGCHAGGFVQPAGLVTSRTSHMTMRWPILLHAVYEAGVIQKCNLQDGGKNSALFPTLINVSCQFHSQFDVRAVRMTSSQIEQQVLEVVYIAGVILKCKSNEGLCDASALDGENVKRFCNLFPIQV
ncbi:hypothetical protein DAPPUDRAFT_241942 [Daphnia pulex]|uniref:Uncharacterized protein n=1 Tax=Daphnia pulex TaxID=6669 RepID=E9GFF9_DAPPU|nr:hypothetical protein DAPPUDRAFT_241942 [Daphnia pulex]|eukprot:EFX81817.1 hypothetical protein DAPPUDRAFT_241942 [Daphnia pulex]